MRSLISIMGCIFCIAIGYFVAMAWVNMSEGRDIFANTPIAGEIASNLEAKVLALVSSIRHN